jgi:hypothetical protein
VSDHTIDDAMPVGDQPTCEEICVKWGRRGIDLDAAAATLMSWTDKMRTQAQNDFHKKVLREQAIPMKFAALPQRDFGQIPQSQQNLFRLLAVGILEACGAGRE